MALIISLTAMLVAGHLIEYSLSSINPVRIIYTVFVYIPVFIYEMIKANIKIAFILLNPALPIKPSIVKVKTNVKNKMSKLFLTSSITLTPGTLTIDTKDESIYVHCTTIEQTDEQSASAQIAEPFEKHVKRVSD